jgi:tRNA dimethylallyltransferase
VLESISVQSGTSASCPRIVALVGPTGAGKTDLAITLAQRFGAEIVNADSRQVYRRLDIGSAKPTAVQRALVPHHGLDVVDPDEPFDCARYRQLALAAIADITRRGKRVLLVGGTGLYIKVLLRGVFAGPSRDPVLRARLEQQEAAEPGSLHRQLSAVDPITAARRHPHDHLRVIRALEVWELTGKPISAWQAEHAFAEAPFETLLLGLSLPRAELYARITARCEAMVRHGLVEEVRALYATGLDPVLPSLRSLGYREIGEYVRGRCDLPAALSRMAQATRRLAKRQLTWFRADPQVMWCPPEPAALHAVIQSFWNLST